MTKTVHDVKIVSARGLVESNTVYSADWAFYAKPACDCGDLYEELHTCVEPRQQMLEVFKRIRINQEFTDHILTHGVLRPIIIYPLEDGRLYMENGHHRLAVAYEYDLMIPIARVDNFKTEVELPLGY